MAKVLNGILKINKTYLVLFNEKSDMKNIKKTALNLMPFYLCFL